MNLLKRPFVRIFAVSAVCALIAYIICFFVPKRSKAVETLYFPMATESHKGLSGLAGLGAAAQGDPGSVPLLGNALSTPLPGAAPATAVGIVESYSTIQAIIDKFDLKNKWGLDETKTYQRVQSELGAGVDPDTNFVSVTFTDNDEQLAQQVVNFAQKTFDSKSNSLLFNVGKTNRVFIQKRLALAEDELNQKQNSLVALGEKSPLAAVDELQKSYYGESAKLIDAQASLSGIHRRIASLEASLLKVYSSHGVESTSELNAMGGANSELGILATEIANRRLQLEDAMSSFQEGAVELQKAKSKVADALKTASDISSELKKGVSQGYDPSLIEARAQERALEATVGAYQSAVEEFRQDLQKSPSQAALVERARDEYEAAGLQVKTLRQQLAQAQIAEDRDPSRYEVLDPVHIDPNYSFPRKGLIAGAVFAIIFILQLLPLLKNLVVEE